MTDPRLAHIARDDIARALGYDEKYFRDVKLAELQSRCGFPQATGRDGAFWKPAVLAWLRRASGLERPGTDGDVHSIPALAVGANGIDVLDDARRSLLERAAAEARRAHENGGSAR